MFSLISPHWGTIADPPVRPSRFSPAVALMNKNRDLAVDPTLTYKSSLSSALPSHWSVSVTRRSGTFSQLNLGGCRRPNKKKAPGVWSCDDGRPLYLRTCEPALWDDLDVAFSRILVKTCFYGASRNMI